jgi:enoyl-[acyl-carrier protein] reductase II
VNLPLAFLQDPSIVDMIVAEGIEFVTTSAGSPDKYGPVLKEAGLIVFHVVPTLKGAQRAVDAGVDGLVVEGGEGGGFKSPTPVLTMVLLPLVRSRVDVPIIAAGGIADGHGMAGAFALGAEGVLMGTRFMSSAESPVHVNWKQAITDCDVTLNIEPGMPGIRMRIVGNELGEAVFRGEVDPAGNPYAGPFLDAFEHGRLDRAMVGCGESASLIGSIKTVAEIIDETVGGFWAEIERLAAMLHGAGVVTG